MAVVASGVARSASMLILPSMRVPFRGEPGPTASRRAGVWVPIDDRLTRARRRACRGAVTTRRRPGAGPFTERRPAPLACRLLTAGSLPAPDDPRYAALWAQSPGRSAFDHPCAVAAFAEAFDLPARILAVVEGGGWTAAVPVFEKRRGPFVASALPPLCPVHRPLLAAPSSEAASHRRDSPLDALLVRLGAEVDQAMLALGDDDVRPYAWAGWTVTPRSTYHIPLDGDVTALFSSDVRRRIRRDTPGYEMVEDPALAVQSVRLIQASYRRHDLDLGVDEGAMVRLANAMQTAGLARTVAARRDGVVEAAVVLTTDGRTASYWIAGSVPGPAMTVLLGHTLPRLAAEGHTLFDFCGANTPSVAEFKRRFGSTLSPAPLARLVSHPVLRVADRFRPR